MGRALTLSIAAVSIAACVCGAQDSPPTQVRNVVFLLADDLGWMDVSPNHPQTFYDTPNLERLARSGVRFTQAYAAAPVCSPTRSSILTGQHPARTANTDYFGAANGHAAIPPDYEPSRDGRFGGRRERPIWPAPYLDRLAAEHVTLAEALRERGYATFFAGKWHLGPRGSWPTDHGFDVNVGGNERGGPYGGNKYFSPYGNPTLEDGPEGEHLPDRLARETVRFLEAHRDEPFLAYLSFYSVHTPLLGRPDLVATYRERSAAIDPALPRFAEEPPRRVRILQDHAVYAAMVTALDQAVGTVLDGLERLGLADETLVVFFSDNGGLSTSEGSPTANVPLRAGKGWLYEGGIREPLFVRWPGVATPGSTCDRPVLSTDFYPTILEVLGHPPRPEQHRDGASFAALLRDPNGPAIASRPLFWHYPHWGNQGGTPGSAIRDGDWKLVRWDFGKPVELFHLGRDLSETTNRAAEHPEIVERLTRRLESVLVETRAHHSFRHPGFTGPFEKWRP